MDNENLKKQFTDLYNKESDAIFRFSLFRVSDRETAVDITEDTFARYWSALLKHKEIDNSRAFLWKTAHNLVIDWYRKKKSLSLERIEEESGIEDFESRLSDYSNSIKNLEIEQEGRFVMDLLGELDPSCERIIYLRYVEGMRPIEIGEILKISANVASVRINRCIEKFRGITGIKKD